MGKRSEAIGPLTFAENMSLRVFLAYSNDTTLGKDLEELFHSMPVLASHRGPSDPVHVWNGPELDLITQL